MPAALGVTAPVVPGVVGEATCGAASIVDVTAGGPPAVSVGGTRPPPEIPPAADVVPLPAAAGPGTGCCVVPPLGSLGTVARLVTVNDETSGFAMSTENGAVESAGSSVPTSAGASWVMYGTIARLSSPGVVSAPPSTRKVTVAPSEETLPG